MALRWAIEAGVYGKEAGPLLAEIRRRGMAVDRVSHRCSWIYECDPAAMVDAAVALADGRA